MSAAPPESVSLTPRTLTMKYAGGLVKHLGLSMYRGAVPAIAELISNAWDADATRVDVTVPFGVGLAGTEIRVRDNGCGMTWEECDEAYLTIGRDRRIAEGSLTPAGRKRSGGGGWE